MLRCRTWCDCESLMRCFSPVALLTRMALGPSIIRRFLSRAVSAWLSVVLGIDDVVRLMATECDYDITRIAVWQQSASVQNRRAVLFRKMVIHYMRGEHAQAEDSVRRMLRIDPYDVPVLAWLGTIHRDAGRRSDALRAFKKAAASYIDSIEA